MKTKLVARALACLPAALSAALPMTLPVSARAEPPLNLTLAPALASLDPVVVTAPPMASPLEVVVDPKAPQQPIPANDGASFLKNIPGFSLIRKGGTDGDPVFRGSAGSRLNIILDGMEFHGGCSSRMDPPTAYVFPESYDSVTVIKGPQSVRYGNGNSAGIVIFEHLRESDEQGLHGEASLMAGSWGRVDGLATLKAVSDKTRLAATLTHSESDDYEDGHGNRVNSRYERQSATLLGGVQLTTDTRVDLDLVASRGEAAYADRTLDGSKFDRESVGLALETKNLSSLVKKVTARFYHSEIDHVMDNYSLRDTPNCGAGTDTACSVMNPDRTTKGARIWADLSLSSHALLLGIDHRSDEHTGRMKMPMMMNTVSLAQAKAVFDMPRLKDFQSRFDGIFVEGTTTLANGAHWKWGLRVDAWEGERFDAGVFKGSDEQTLTSGFIRLERLHPSMGMTTFVGLGHAQRPMDYWEARQKGGITAAGVVTLDPEKTTQIDLGAVWRGEKLRGSLSLFYADIQDYILISGASSSLNVDATRYGLEADVRYALESGLSLFGSLAYVRAENDTMNVPLAQTPPLEIKLGADYRLGTWSVGGLVRHVAKQDRIHPNFGSIVGLDRAAGTPGFTTFGLHGSYDLARQTQISFGVDNVFDRNYYEHISRADSTLAGYVTDLTTAVNEPGRTYWVKARAHF